MIDLTVKKARVIIIGTIIGDINDALDILHRAKPSDWYGSPLSPVQILEQKRWDLSQERRKLREEIEYAEAHATPFGSDVACYAVDGDIQEARP